MRRLPLIVTAAVLAAACAPEGAATSTTIAPTTTAVATTTPEITTTITIPVGTTAPFEDRQERDLLFDVTGIESGSVAGYAGAGTNFDEAATFYAGQVALEATGATNESIDGTIWREIHTSGTSTAWVDDSFLTLNTTAVVRFADVPCSSFGTPSGEIARTGPSESDADHVAQVWQISWPDCTRVVIALGAEFDFANASPLAATTPEQVSVEAFGTWARVQLPGIQWTRVDASEDLGDLTVVVARSLEGTLVADIHSGAPGEYFARFLSNPARIVVDILPAAVASVVISPPTVGDAVILPEGLPPTVSMPLTISGYSRWFEAGGFAVVRRQADQPGTGEIIGAIVTGDAVVNPGTGTEWGITATDWLDAWGTFSFELSGLGNGAFEVFIGECRMLDEEADTCTDVGAYLPIVVGG